MTNNFMFDNNNPVSGGQNVASNSIQPSVNPKNDQSAFNSLGNNRNNDMNINVLQ